MLTLASSQVVGSAAANTLAVPSSSISWATGDVIVVKCAAEGNGTFTSVTASGLTFTSRASLAAGSNCFATIWAAVAASASSGVVTATYNTSASAQWHSACFEQWTSAQLAGTPATNTTKTGTGAPSTTLTTVAANSAVSWLDADFAAVAPGTPAYRSSATAEGIHDKSTANYVAYYATQAAASAGSQTFGLTAPAGQTWTLLGIEVQDSAAAAPALPIIVLPPRR